MGEVCYYAVHMTVKLDVTKREAGAEINAITQIAGVVYGPKQEAVPIMIGRSDFEKTFKQISESTIITLDGLSEPIEVLVHDVSFSPTKGGITHVDFYAIERGKEMTTNIGIDFVGESPIEKTGGLVNKILHEVEVTCRPSVLPSHFEVDISTLANADDKYLVSDIVVPAGVTIETPGDEVIAIATAARTSQAEEDEESGEVDMDAVEVEQKGKGEEEDTDADAK